MTLRPASNNQVKAWKKLKLGKYRKREGLFIAEGERCVTQILENRKVTVLSILLQEDYSDTHYFETAGVKIYTLSGKDFSDVTDTETPQGIAAICAIPEETDLQNNAYSNPIIAAFDAVQDPGNLGTMIRTASWFGASGLLFGEGTVDPFHPKVVRSTAGATGILPYKRGDMVQLLTEMEASGYHTYLLDASPGSKDLKTVSSIGKTILLVGNEANGVNPNLFGSQRTAVKIEGRNKRVESLNAAVALSIALWHFAG